MSRTSKLRIFCYDVSDNKRRRRIARILEDNASRVQYSVFEGRLSRKAVAQLTKKLEAHLEGNDSLRIYTVGKTGERHCTITGKGVPIDKDDGYWLF